MTEKEIEQAQAQLKMIENANTHLRRIEGYALIVKMALAMGEIEASDWCRIGHAVACLNRSATDLMLDLIGSTHSLYNPIPGMKAQ